MPGHNFEHMSIEQIMENPETFQILKKAAQQDQFMEAVDFLIDFKKMETLMNAPEPGTVAEKVQQKREIRGIMQRLYTSYILEIDRSQLPVPEAIKKISPVNVSEGVKKEIVGAMNPDAHQLRSQKFQSFKKAKNEVMDYADIQFRASAICKDEQALHDLDATLPDDMDANQILHFEAGQELYKDFAKKTYSEDNYNFLMAMQDMLPENKGRLTERQRENIYSKYIAVGSDDQVNISAPLRNQIRDSCPPRADGRMIPSQETLLLAQNEINKMVTNDNLSRFKQDPSFAKFAQSAEVQTHLAKANLIAQRNNLQSGLQNFKKATAEELKQPHQNLHRGGTLAQVFHAVNPRAATMQGKFSSDVKAMGELQVALDAVPPPRVIQGMTARQVEQAKEALIKPIQNMEGRLDKIAGNDKMAPRPGDGRVADAQAFKEVTVAAKTALVTQEAPRAEASARNR